MFAFQQFYLLCDKRRDFIVVVVVKNNYRFENLTAASINALTNARVK
jgi:hypothetical protein